MAIELSTREREKKEFEGIGEIMQWEETIASIIIVLHRADDALLSLQTVV